MVNEHVPFEQLVAWTEGCATPEVAQHVDACAACQERGRRMQHDLAGLAELPATLDDVDLVRQLKLDLARRRRRVGWLAAGAMAAAALWAIPFPSSGPDHRAKGGGTSPSNAGIAAYRVDGRGGAVLIDGRIHSNDALVFTYDNNGDPPWHYLMVFAVDDGGGVHWYYPAHVREGDDPVSVPIGRGGGVSLGEQIRHPLRVGPMQLWSIFSAEPWRVLEVEKRIERGEWPGDTRGALVHHRNVEVVQ